MSEIVVKDLGDSLPIRRYAKPELLSILKSMDTAKSVLDDSDEEAAIVSAIVSADEEIRDAGSMWIIRHFRYLTDFQQGKTSHAEDLLIRLAVDTYRERPTKSALILKNATEMLALRQLDSFYKIEAQNFYKKCGDTRNSLEDYRQEAATCIVEKLDEYDPQKGKLSTYFKAQFRGRFTLLLVGEGRKYFSAKLSQIDRAKAAMETDGIYDPDYSQIAEWMNAHGSSSRPVTARQVEKILQSRITCVPIDSVTELVSTIPGTEEAAMQNADQEDVYQAVKELDPVMQVICVVWMRSLDLTGNNPTDKALKSAVKKAFPELSDRAIQSAKNEFIRHMGRKCQSHHKSRRVTEKNQNVSQADFALLDAIQDQYPDGFPE